MYYTFLSFWLSDRNTFLCVSTTEIHPNPTARQSIQNWYDCELHINGKGCEYLCGSLCYCLSHCADIWWPSGGVSYHNTMRKIRLVKQSKHKKMQSHTGKQNFWCNVKPGIKYIDIYFPTEHKQSVKSTLTYYCPVFFLAFLMRQIFTLLWLLALFFIFINYWGQYLTFWLLNSYYDR